MSASSQSMRRRVTIICNSYPPEKGGAPTRIYHLAKLLQENRYKVEVIAAMPNYPKGAIFPGYRGRLVYKEVMEGITVRRTWIYPSNSANPVLRGLSMISQVISLWLLALPSMLFRRPHLTIVSSPPLLAGSAGIMIGRMSSSKTLLNVSDIWPMSASELGAMKRGRIFRLLQGIERRMYRRAQGWMAQSNETLRYMKQEAAVERPSFLNGNLVQADRKASREPGTKKILYAGLLGHAQGVLDICKAIDFSAHGTSLDIYGDGAERNEIERFIAAHPNRGIAMHPTISQAGLIEKLPAYRAMLVPLKAAIHGALPSKLFFALAHQVPVLYCGGGEGASIVSREKIGWVSEPGDMEGLHGNIIRFLAQDAKEFSDTKAHLLHASAVFNARVQGKDFIEFLKKFLA